MREAFYSVIEKIETLDNINLEQKIIFVIASWSKLIDNDYHVGFLVRLYNKEYAYLTGLCYECGWGCCSYVDRIKYFDTMPELTEIEEEDVEWSFDNNDLNKLQEKYLPEHLKVIV